jgi:hypothetical protein
MAKSRTSGHRRNKRRSRRRDKQPSPRSIPPASYYGDLRQAMARFLPHQGLPLIDDDGRVRWTPRLLVHLAIFMAWSAGGTLTDRFYEAREALVGIYGSRKRPGQTDRGFARALVKGSERLLPVLCDHWRQCVRQIAHHCWEMAGWVLIGVDGSTFDCPRTAANEEAFGITGKNNSGPQQLVTCLFHVCSGLLWGWRRGGIQGSSERGQLREMIHLLPPNALLLADAGFCGYDLLTALLAQGSSFLMRVGANVHLLTKLGYEVHEDKQTVYLWPLDKQGRRRGKAMPKSLKHVKPPLVLRLIRLKEVAGQTVCLLTNAGPERLSDVVAARMYKLRWGIEVMWRDLKQTMSHHKTLGGCPERARVELDWAMAGLWMLQLISVERMIASGQLPHRYSPASSLRVLRRAMGGKRTKRRTLVSGLTRAVKDTYCRKGSKKARHYPKKRPQRPPGEPRARTASRAEKRLAQRLFEQLPPKLVAA